MDSQKITTFQHFNFFKLFQVSHIRIKNNQIFVGENNYKTRF